MMLGSSVGRPQSQRVEGKGGWKRSLADSHVCENGIRCTRDNVEEKSFEPSFS